MSTFLGLIEEIPGISVDRFDGENLRSSAYFLSHCHTDHMRGLNFYFFESLVKEKKYLYCSAISKMFLLSDKCLANKASIEICVKTIEIEKGVSIEYKNEHSETDTVFVTCISAGHCPGSVMFLFEKPDKTILYTGDFRINSNDYKKIVSLHVYNKFGGSPKKLTKLYLDTTFLDPDFISFPSRKECISKIRDVVKEWLEKNSANVVLLQCSALYGSEFLYEELAKILETRIHVKDFVYDNYCRFVMADYITTEPFSARIHACTDKRDRSGLKCPYVRNVSTCNILIVVPSVLRWKGKDTSVVGEWDTDQQRVFNVCYATHASFDELKKFIQYYKPESIYACVCKEHEEQRVYGFLKEIQNEVRTDHKDSACEKYTMPILKHDEIKKDWTRFYF